MSVLAQSIRLPPFPQSPTNLDLFSYIQSNLQVIENLNTTEFHRFSQEQTVFWKILLPIFGRETRSSSIGSLYFSRHMLSRLWNMVREQGSLYLFAVLITFCRVYSRMYHVDILQYVEKAKGVDLDNILISAAEIFDRKQLFNVKKELEKFVLNREKFSQWKTFVDTPDPTTMEDSGLTRLTRNQVVSDGAPSPLQNKRYGPGKSKGVSFLSNEPGTPREEPEKYPLCYLCKNPVHGLFVSCQFCRHVFHVQHYLAWLSEHDFCPVIGCGNHCEHIAPMNSL